MALTKLEQLELERELFFRDGGIYIYSNADGKLYIKTDGSGDDDVTLGSSLTIDSGETFTLGGDTIKGLKEIITMGLGNTVAVNSFPFNNVTTSAADATYAAVTDASDDTYELASSDDGGGYTAALQCFPDTEAENDAVYFGSDSAFCCLYFDVSATNATYSDDTAKWQYWDGSAWADLTIIYDGTDSTANDGLRPFQQDGYLVFSPPTDWESTTVNSQDGYFIRSIVTAANCTQIPVLEDEHKTVVFDAATKIPYAGTVSRGRFNFGTTSGTSNDTKVVLVNLTAQTVSAEKTITGGKTDFEIADFALDISADDEIGFFVTQEDGSTEYAGGTVELTFTRS